MPENEKRELEHIVDVGSWILAAAVGLFLWGGMLYMPLYAKVAITALGVFTVYVVMRWARPHIVRLIYGAIDKRKGG